MNAGVVDFGVCLAGGESTVHARLCRILPHLADVITLACWPETIDMPDGLDAHGRPKRATAPLPCQERRGVGEEVAS